jgi:hypothetical protein
MAPSRRSLPDLWKAEVPAQGIASEISLALLEAAAKRDAGSAGSSVSFLDGCTKTVQMIVGEVSVVVPSGRDGSAAQGSA